MSQFVRDAPIPVVTAPRTLKKRVNQMTNKTRLCIAHNVMNSNSAHLFSHHKFSLVSNLPSGQ